MTYKPDDILMYWGQSANIWAFKDTYPTNGIVFALANYYYLDCGFGNKYGEKTFCDPFKTWWTLYEFEPTDYIDDGSVLGGEAPIWGELNSDLCVNPKIWPRAAALADKYWG